LSPFFPAAIDSLSYLLYEIAQVDVATAIKSTASMAKLGLNSEPQNRRISKGGFARAAQALAPRVAQSFLN